MNKHEFLIQFNESLKGLSEVDRNEIVADYEEHFAEGFKRGMNEDEICRKLGKPENLAKAYHVQTELQSSVPPTNNRSKVSVTFKAIALLVMLAPFNAFLILVPGSVIASVLIGTLCVALVILVAGASFLVGAPFFADFTNSGLNAYFLGSLGSIALGVGGIILTSLCAIVVAKAIVQYVKFSLSLITSKGV